MTQLKTEPLLRVRDLKVTFGSKRNPFTAVGGVSFDIYKGETFGLVGESGSGKTTIGRAIIRIHPTAGGTIEFKGQRINGKIDKALDREITRKIQMIFQDPMASLNERAKVDYIVSEGLYNIGGITAEQRRDRVHKALAAVGLLPEFASRFPHEFSGGQRQRVAIARALACDPQLLLLDEPLGALDLQLRRQMQGELKALQKKLGITFIYITHDQEEALNMSDLIAVMNGGQFEQIGAPEEIYEHPTTRFAAQFIGQSNIIEGVVASAGQGSALVEVCPGNAMVVPGAFQAGERIALSVRAERIDYADKADYGFTLAGVIKMHSYIGGVLRTTIELPTGQELLITGANPVSKYPAGCRVFVFWDPAVAAVVERGKGE